MQMSLIIIQTLLYYAAIINKYAGILDDYSEVINDYASR